MQRYPLGIQLPKQGVSYSRWGGMKMQQARSQFDTGGRWEG